MKMMVSLSALGVDVTDRLKAEDIIRSALGKGTYSGPKVQGSCWRTATEAVKSVLGKSVKDQNQQMLVILNAGSLTAHAIVTTLDGKTIADSLAHRRVRGTVREGVIRYKHPKYDSIEVDYNVGYVVRLGNGIKAMSEMISTSGTQDGTYASLKFTQESIDALDKKLTSVGLERTTKMGFHMTVIYDESTPFEDRQYPQIAAKQYAVAKKVTILGDKQNIAAIEMHCPAAEDFHHELRNEGLKHSFDDYLPHVSVLKDFTSDQLVTLTKLLEDEDIVMEISHAVVEALTP